MDNLIGSRKSCAEATEEVRHTRVNARDVHEYSARARYIRTRSHGAAAPRRSTPPPYREMIETRNLPVYRYIARVRVRDRPRNFSLFPWWLASDILSRSSLRCVGICNAMVECG
ncbi:hypothetical protein PISMIDRAFT_680800 [Pisolithus microcarpus 441]|uniref:Uncharacterized protein n=1 Tax=Pisolithus microcarpus 441 TaxID=765257 RepID=A0A0C9ZQQ2_9AGAM|nr:hypothetical protein PISMIDRAFT_680800 [Pisolithus microcarpus 441]